MLVGYARVSTQDQSLESQIKTLKTAGCERIFHEKTGGQKLERKELSEALNFLRAGDTLVVIKIDRLGRSLSHLVNLIEELRTKDIGFKSINDPIDTTTPSGRLIFNIFASLAEFELSLIRERTIAGLKSSKARGIKGGRKPSLNPIQIKSLRTLYQSKEHSISDICNQFGISKKTLYNYLNISSS